MGMALPKAGGGDLHKLRLALELLHTVAAGVAHTRPQAAHELVNGLPGQALVRHTALDAFWDQFLVVLLEIAVLGTLGHSAQAAHAAVDLELAALIHLGFAGGFLTARQQRAQHDHVGARGQSLGDVAGILDAAVGDDGHSVLRRHTGRIVHSGDLRHADTGHHTGGTDGAGADADLHAVRARLNEGAGTLCGGHVARDQLHVGIERLDAAHTLQDIMGMAVGGVQRQHVGPRFHQSGHPVQHVGGNADGGAHQQASFVVAGGIGVDLGLFNVLDGDQALEMELIVHNGELFHLVAPEDLLGLLQRGALLCGDQVVLSHHVIDQLAHIGLELHIPVGDDADELSVVADGYAGDLILGAQLIRLGQRMAGGQPEGVCDDAVLTALDHIHLLGLCPDGHVLVDDADTPFPGDGDGHAVLGNGIHGGAHQRDV